MNPVSHSEQNSLLSTHYKQPVSQESQIAMLSSLIVA